MDIVLLLHSLVRFAILLVAIAGIVKTLIGLPERSVPAKTIEVKDHEPTGMGNVSTVFLSYAHEDRAIVDDLAQRIQAAGVPTWYDPKLTPGRSWSEELESAIRGAQALIVMLSPDSTSSEYVRKEIHFAQEAGTRIIPIMIRATKLPLAISDVQYIDAQGRDPLPKLLAALAGSSIPRKSISSSQPARPALSRIDNVDQTIASAFVGLYDLQALLGVLIILLGGLAQAIHPIVMIVGILLAHGLQTMVKRAEGSRAAMYRLALYIIPLLVILVGLASIGHLPV